MRVELGGAGFRHSNAAVRRGIAGQNSDVHADAFARQPHEPFHLRPVSVQKRFFPDDRPTFKELTTQAALEMLRRALL